MLVVIIIVHVVNIFSVSFKHQTCQPQHTHPRNVPLPCPAAPLTPRPIHFELVGRAPWTLERASTRGFRVNSRMGRQAGMTKPTCGGLCPRGEQKSIRWGVTGVYPHFFKSLLYRCLQKRKRKGKN